MLPLNVLEELIKPITLALRLFGNIFAGGIMLALIAPDAGLHPVGAQRAAGSCFDMAIGGIQAFIFALLTVLYFAMAGAGHGDARTRRARTTSTTPTHEAETTDHPYRRA